MPFHVFCLAVFHIFPGILSQASDYETTPYSLGPTSFSCQGRPPGYYADLETGCRTYHVCDGNSHFTYVCPRRTLFQQKMRICDHSYLVNCEDSFTYDDVDFYNGGHEELFESEEIDDGLEDELTDIRNRTAVVPVATASNEPTETTSSIEYDSELPTASTSPADQPPPPQDVVLPKFLKFKLKDFRSLFYIPEIENNSLERSTEKSVVIPLDRKQFMRFKNRPEVFKRYNGSSSLCPGYCDPRFFTPGTCHPCIMIK